MRQTGIAGGLFAGVACWVMLLSLLSPSPNTMHNFAAPAADGSRCDIKFVDKSRFASGSTPGEVVVRMDIVDHVGKPIVNLKESNFEVVEEDLPGRVTSFRGPQSQTINVVLVIDVSGSMNQDNRIAGARESASAVIDVLKDDRDRLAIIPFDDSMHILRPLQEITASNRLSCHSLVRSLSPRGGTSIGPPTLEALNLYKDAVDGAKMVLVMTDGEDSNFPSHVESIVHLAEERGAQVHTIGFGRAVGRRAETALKELAQRCAGQYQHAPSNEELAKIFSARVQETINECTLVYDSPYPQPDGLPRKVNLKCNSPRGLLNASFTYQVGPILGGRSSPATWVTVNGTAPAASGVVTVILSMILFVGLLGLLGAGLVMPELVLGKTLGLSSASNPRAVTTPVGTTPSSPAVRLPPPPGAVLPPAKSSANTVQQSLPQTPAPKPNSGAAAELSLPHQPPVGSKPFKLPPPPPKKTN